MPSKNITTSNIYWKVITGEGHNVGFNHSQALNYCKSMGSYVSLPSNSEYFSQIFEYTGPMITWTGLKQSSDNLLKWERNNRTYTGFDILNFDAMSDVDTTQYCVEIFMSDDNLSVVKRLVDCNKKMSSFICEYSLTELEAQTIGSCVKKQRTTFFCTKYICFYI